MASLTTIGINGGAGNQGGWQMVGMAGDSSRRRGRRMICGFVCSYVNSTLRIVEESMQRSVEADLSKAIKETKSLGYNNKFQECLFLYESYFVPSLAPNITASTMELYLVETCKHLVALDRGCTMQKSCTTVKHIYGMYGKWTGHCRRYCN